ncbi:flagellar biosynthetic protein FliO [Ectothiorhodospira variabilis]|uniref:flagellar biosynthetic protein FliO n=1 Tax=Ectothiorhodospira variabilis TaxID=505694 RepID=UPI001EFA93E3|nr:flagellar biosynthetic protein FliO [Ectothiorhodospira variabilis]MCG5494056.1 flagellar biosynthetic protein FliO [Ectothiorhodospira variabilis]MCG5503414.1 flagellar biosynthetic protein FliO [Ectothiorhodospira variabilis]MCG5506498.1 flagellar biosynthetic protein FliO [Ectothiorhodospira variabilis]
MRTATQIMTALGLLCMPWMLAAEEVQRGTPGLGVTGDGAAHLVQLVLGLVVVVAAILVLGFVLRRIHGLSGGLSSDFRVLGSVSLGSRERMVLVQVGDVQMVVGVAPGRVQTLHVLERPIDVNPTAVKGADPSFAQRLRTAMSGQGASS